MARFEHAGGEAPGWCRRVSRFHRRPFGLARLIGLVTIAVLLDATGCGLRDQPVSSPPSRTGPAPTLTRSVSAPAQPMPFTVPAITLAPASIVRSGNTFRLTGEFPDRKAKAALVQAVSAALPPGGNIVDQLGINPNVDALDFSDAETVFAAAAPIADFRLTVQGDTITLTGTAATAERRDAVGQAAEDAWPELSIANTMDVAAR